MISKTVKENILRAMLGISGSVSIASNCYLGLLTDISVDEDGNPSATEVPTDFEFTIQEQYQAPILSSVPTGYSRTLIGLDRTPETQKMSVSKGKATNKDAIMTCECLKQVLPESATTEYPEHPWGEIRYFALYAAKTGGQPVAWGKILDEETKEPITLNPGWKEIPVIRVNQLNLTLEDSDENE